MRRQKQKTRKSISRRFKITKTGKVLHERSFGSHLKASKNSTRRRKSRKLVRLEGRVAVKIKKIMKARVK